MLWDNISDVKSKICTEFQGLRINAPLFIDDYEPTT